MVSERLRSLVRCPDCGGTFTVVAGALSCARCGRKTAAAGEYLDLRPAQEAGESTKYLDEALHADGRQSSVSPPLLSAGVRNDMMRRFLKPGPADVLADLGCGSGRMMLWNRASGAYMVGVDASPHFAVEALSTVDLVLGDLRRLPLPDASFTKAYSFDVAEHLTQAGLDAMLGEAARILAPGGQLFLYSHVRKNSRLALGLRMINASALLLERIGLVNLQQDRLRKSDHLNPLATPEDLHSTIERAGLRLVAIRYYTPLVGALIENILLRIAESAISRRVRRTLAPDAAASGQDAPLVRARGKQLAAGGFVGAVLRFLTWVMKLDLVLFGHVKTGPFFALLEKRQA
jgi:ubiquinone/menaquinone biosynthesis C-methylase UbiE